jgi:hypothetical protein
MQVQLEGAAQSYKMTGTCMLISHSSGVSAQAEAQAKKRHGTAKRRIATERAEHEARRNEREAHGKEASLLGREDDGE